LYVGVMTAHFAAAVLARPSTPGALDRAGEGQAERVNRAPPSSWAHWTKSKSASCASSLTVHHCSRTKVRRRSPLAPTSADVRRSVRVTATMHGVAATMNARGRQSCGIVVASRVKPWRKWRDTAAEGRQCVIGIRLESERHPTARQATAGSLHFRHRRI
jgi:hypothetical protein